GVALLCYEFNCSEWPAGPDDRAPHVRDRARIESQPLARLPEMAADDLRERLQRDLGLRIEGVFVVQGDEPRLHVPAMLSRLLVGGDEIRLGQVVLAEDLPIRRRVFVPDGRVGEGP